MIYLSVAILLLDQITKELIRRHLHHGAQVPICSIFNLSHVHNTGAAWGIMAGSSGLLVWVSIIALILLIVCRRSLMDEGRLQRLAMASIIGGILGNLVDRIRLGFVVDFLDFHWKHHHFPSFNVADAAISCGVVFYLIGSWLSGWGEKQAPSGQDALGAPDAAPKSEQVTTP